MTGKLRNRFLFFSLLVLINDFCPAQKEIILKRKIVVEAPDMSHNIDRCVYSLLVPASRPGKQDVYEYKYGIKPNHVVKTEQGEYYLKWKDVSFAEVKKNNIEVTVKVRISRYDLKTAKLKPVKDPTDLDTLLYLKDEENFRSESKPVQKIAETLKGGSREEIVKSIFDYTIYNMEYCIFSEQDRGAKKALKEGKGDCTEYSELMVTLCRAKKIPARIVKGLIPKSNGSVGHHNWVEVFFPEYGWVAFDPTWADAKNPRTSFDSMLNSYVQLSNKRFVKSATCSCNTDQFGFSYHLSDSCVDLTKGISLKVKDLVYAYNKNDFEKALGLLDTLLKHESDNYLYWTFYGMIYSRKGDFENGISGLENALANSRSVEEKCATLYAFSNHYALKDDKENAMKYLKESIELGFKKYDHMVNDADLINLKDHPPFKELIEELKKKKN